MLKAGIVGVKNSNKYIQIIEKLENYSFSGVYDPSFQIDLSLYNSINSGFLSYEELLVNSDIIIFSSDDKVFFTLMKDALACSKVLFLDKVHKYTFDQLQQLADMAYEANSFVQVCHVSKYHDLIKNFLDLGVKPIVVNETIEVTNLDKILRQVREEITVLLGLVGNKVRRIRTNISSSQVAIPNIYQINLEFNNGCILNLLASSVNMPYRKELRVIGQNSNVEMDFVNNSFVMFDGVNTYEKQFDSHNNTDEELITKQLEDVYLNYLDQGCFKFSLENEMETCLVVEKITDKLKISMNIL